MLNWLATFAFVNLTWVFFRADSIGDACRLIANIGKLEFGAIDLEIANAFALPELAFVLNLLPNLGALSDSLIMLIGFFVVSMAIAVFSRNTYERMKRFEPNMFAMLYTAVLAVWCVLSFAGVSTFLYFNF